MPTDKARYPKNWRDISAQIRARAGNRCEWPDCGVANGATVQGKRRPYQIVLTVAHLDHDPTHNDPSNLRAWCQPHHLRYDAQLHAQHAQATRQRKQAEQAERIASRDANDNNQRIDE